MHHTIVLSFVILMTFISCSNEGIEVLEGNIDVIKRIRLGSSESYTPNYTYYNEVFTSSKVEYLGRLNHVTNVIEVYPLAKRLKHDSLVSFPKVDIDDYFLERQRPKIKAFLVANQQLYSFNEFFIGKNQVFDLLNESSPIELNLSDVPIRSIMFSSNKIYKLEDKIYYTNDPQYQVFAPQNAQSLYWEGSISLINGQLEEYLIPLPQTYRGKINCPSAIIPSRCMSNEGLFYYSYPLSDSIYKTDLAGNTEWLKDSINHDVFTTYTGKADDTDCFQSYSKGWLYENILFDNYANLLYRIYSFPNAEDSNVYNKNLGVVVYTSEFTRLAHFRLSGNLYSNEFFLSSKGLWVKTKSPILEFVNISIL